MADFLRDLLTAEDHAAPYVWAAVALAHAMIGACLMTCAALLASLVLSDAVLGLALVAVGYSIWELLQAVAGGPPLDGLLDWLCVMLGAAMVAAVWERRVASGAASVIGLWAVVAAGVRQRIGGR
ncbi:hypothetical protein [Paracoccus contaminans]|uniref:VanZ-like domain-containing protein n=1 Tax=Paracoccus contaminans TaxID=1945662 RepID=A0A1W6D000_9RHOB|nr:hypothetical protein [Paracoccus contaminans]ARJ70428.1 hypothetical protein B0A89_13070 [Paracoccus contaminans]